MPIVVTTSPAVFASANDIASRLGVTFTTTEQAQADAFCGDATELIRDYCRQDITAATGITMDREAPDGPWFDLPQRPVTGVTSVAVNGQTVTDFSQIGDRLYRVYGWRWPSVDTIPPLAIYGLKSTVHVVYDAGYPEVPGVIHATCVRMVLRAMDNPTGLDQAGIDDYTPRFNDGRGGVFLTDDDKRAVRRYRRAAFSIDQGRS